eukprot:5890976-Alexandrium_andersonii.AAC.1
MAASSKSGVDVDKGVKLEGHQADRFSPPRGRADEDVTPYTSPFDGVAMTSKELSEGGAESFRLAQNDSAVIQSASHDA